jgi:wyosine [tRNA(Phe)-imidazoG37] synthetase (radical SAM superfamily)
MQILPLETTLTYGPLFSRRLGRSLGVNVLPFDRKVCSFDCVYCHYGYTTLKTLTPSGVAFPAADAILHAIETALRRYPHIDASPSPATVNRRCTRTSRSSSPRRAACGMRSRRT